MKLEKEDEMGEPDIDDKENVEHKLDDNSTEDDVGDTDATDPDIGNSVSDEDMKEEEFDEDMDGGKCSIFFLPT